MAYKAYESKIEKFLYTVLQGHKNVPDFLLKEIKLEVSKNAVIWGAIQNILKIYFPQHSDEIYSTMTTLGFVARRAGIIDDTGTTLVETLEKVIDLRSSTSFVPVASVLCAIGSVYDTTLNALQAFKNCKAMTEGKSIVEAIEKQLQSCVNVLAEIERLIDQAILRNISYADLLCQTECLTKMLDTEAERTYIAFENFRSNYTNWETRQKELLKDGEQTMQMKGSVKGIVGITMLAGAATFLTGGTAVAVVCSGLMCGAAGVSDIQTSFDYTKALNDLQNLNCIVQKIQHDMKYMKSRRKLLTKNLLSINARFAFGISGFFHPFVIIFAMLVLMMVHCYVDGSTSPTLLMRSWFDALALSPWNMRDLFVSLGIRTINDYIMLWTRSSY